jgi:SAM-dependent methyltransferase
MDFLFLLVVMAALIFFARYFVGVGIGAPWLPLRRRDIPDGFSLVDIGANDVVIDLGSGDGRLLVEAAKRGAKVIGYELNPFLVWWSRHRLKSYELRATIHRQNLLDADLSEATVIYIFGITSIMPRVAKKLMDECRPGTKIISFAFGLPGWKRLDQKGIAIRYER